MNKSEFEKKKHELSLLINDLHHRNEKVGFIHESLDLFFFDTPKLMDSINKFLRQLEHNPINEKSLTEAYSFFKDKFNSHVLFNNKLIKILEVNEETFNKLYYAFNKNITATLDSYTVQELLANDKKPIKFQYNIDASLIAFFQKNVVHDQIKVDLEDRVPNALQQEFVHIYGTKEVDFASFNSVIFDTEKKVIIISHDLSGIIRNRILDKEVNAFIVKVKSTVKNVTFPDHSKNLFGKIKAFYADTNGYAKDLSFKTLDGLIYHIHANAEYPDARQSPYHKSGEKAVQGKLRLFRINKGINTKRHTVYLIDLKSIAAMCTKPNPFLYQASIQSNNVEDFAEAIRSLL